MFKMQDERRLIPNDDALVERENQLTREYQKAIKLEESFLKQKTRVNWLQLRENNNVLFHQSIVYKRNKNNIQCIINGNKNHLENEDMIQDEAECYFKTILALNLAWNTSNFHRQLDNVLIDDQRESLV